ncbi:substrate-binding domain-containing protein [Zooshikella marina]|uniref:substrate-binding domain-containing protein n=1 Tax=Zooshikella ganghwensis TaxID=202772 RepID=UPI001BB07E1C|nr:substrate-binding domain-containing protein [Zooshikella ganghwensis]MBU2705613.1 substrate-binding domain-containing protein [Zooshikella ganghwensis]
MATIKDVAKLAGVSTTTVSHVLNNTRFVAKETQERVYAAVQSLNYAPSAVARSLKVNQTRTLGLLVTSSSNPFFAEVVQGVEAECFKEGYSLLLCTIEGDRQKLRHYLTTLVAKRIDGLLIMCTEYDPLLFSLLESYESLPQVIMDWGPSNEFMDKIQDNSAQGGYLATQYLIDQGHTDIGCVTGPMEKLPSQQRLAGFQSAMDEAKLPINPNWVIAGDFEAISGEQAFNIIWSSAKRPTAMFVGNDVMAMGMICAAYKQGVRVPETLSVIGYDDIPMAEYFIPPLTSISQPKRDLGKLAVTTLVDKIRHKRKKGKTLLLEPSLSIRYSVSRRK